MGLSVSQNRICGCDKDDVTEKQRRSRNIDPNPPPQEAHMG